MVAEIQNAEVALLKIHEVMARVGLSRSVIYVKLRAGKFPAPVYPAKKAPRWRTDAITTWIEGLPEDRAAA